LISLDFLNLIANSILVGLIWVIQLIVYPSFKFIDKNNWSKFHKLHTHKITIIVGWLMPLELLLTFVLIFKGGVSYINLLVAICVIVIWSSTFLIQVPLHNKLSQIHSDKNINLLIKSNWLRTIAWSLKMIFLIVLVGN